MEAIIYNQEGKEKRKIELPADIFGLPWNGDLVHQVVVSMRSNEREAIAHTKDRGEVAGGGKKPWQQKGTGRARHGSIRSPLWVGGGVTHGPRNEKNYARKVNRKMKIKALFTVLSQKLKDKEIIFVDTLGLQRPKTKEARGILLALAKAGGFEQALKKTKNTALLAMAKKDINTERGFQNFSNIEMSDVRNLNPLLLLDVKYVVFSDPEEALLILQTKVSSHKKE